MTLVRMHRPTPARPWSTHLIDEFDRAFGAFATPSAGRSQGATHPVDLYETDDALVFEMAVPGFSHDDLDISVEGRQLTVRTVSAQDQDEDAEAASDEGRRYWLRNIARGEIGRTLRMPSNVDVDAIEARVAEGMLVVRMPKLDEAKVRKIEVVSS